MKMELKIVLLVVLLGGFVAGCSDEVTRPQLPEVEKFTVDATVDQTVVTAGHFVTPHVDGRGGTAPYSFLWYERGEWIGVGEEPAPQQMNEEGFHTFLVVGVDSLGAVAQDSVVVTVLPALLEPLTVDATATHMESHVGDNIRLHADARGGLRPYQEYYWYLDDQNIGVGEEFNRPATEQGIFTFVVVVYDALGTTASDSVRVAVTAPSIIETCVSTDLKVGPYDCDDDEVVHFGHNGEGNMMVLTRWDTSDRRFVNLWLHYADGSVRPFVLPDLGLARPSIVLIDLGLVRVEETMSISMRWTGSPSKDAEKCTQWVTATEFCLSEVGPNKSIPGILTIRLGEGGNYTLIE